MSGFRPRFRSAVRSHKNIASKAGKSAFPLSPPLRSIFITQGHCIPKSTFYRSCTVVLVVCDGFIIHHGKAFVKLFILMLFDSKKEWFHSGFDFLSIPFPSQIYFIVLKRRKKSPSAALPRGIFQIKKIVFNSYYA